jgi:hypothetical protein
MDLHCSTAANGPRLRFAGASAGDSHDFRAIWANLPYENSDLAALDNREGFDIVPPSFAELTTICEN